MAQKQYENMSYLIKHRNKWQVKITIPKNLRWAFNNKTTYKRSTGCNIDDLEKAQIERDKIVNSFKKVLRSFKTRNEEDIRKTADKHLQAYHELMDSLYWFKNQPNLGKSDENIDFRVPSEVSDDGHRDENIIKSPNETFHTEDQVLNSKDNIQHASKFDVGSWIQKRLLEKPRKIISLKHDHWKNKEK